MRLPTQIAVPAGACVAAFVLSAMNANNAAQFIAHASGATGLQPRLFIPIVVTSALSTLFGGFAARSRTTRPRRWAIIGSATVVVPTTVVFGFLSLLAVLGSRTDPHPVGSVVSAISPALAAGAVLATASVGAFTLPMWARLSAVLLLSATPILLAVARVLLVP